MRARGSIGFGLVPSMEAAAHRARLSELCDLVSAGVGTRFFPYYGASYREMMAAVERGDAGIAWLPPLLVLEAVDRKLGSPLVVPVRRGTTSYYAALLVRRGGPRTLAALKGTTVAWVDKESAAGYLVPRAHLASNALDPDRLFARELFLKSHEAVVDAVAAGRADVCATYCTVEPGTHRVLQGGWTQPDGTTTKQVEILTTVGPIPNDALLVADRLPAEVCALLQRWLLSLESARARAIFRETLRADGFQMATSVHYAPLRKLMERTKQG
jgi:phosphonate transport system substrate-binding protein